MPSSNDPAGPTTAALDAHSARVRHDLACLELPGKPWVPRRDVVGEPVVDVVIVGAGMCGLAAAASLRFLGVDNIRVLDRAPAGREGPWITYARMETLRSPKTLAGPALGIPSLTFRAWFEAQFGTEAWERLGKIPRTQWMAYLGWYRAVLDIHVENGVGVGLLRPRSDGLIAVETDTAGTILARHVVLASGRDGLGGTTVPALARSLDRRLWAHSRDDIDFAALRGRRVGVVGAGASAMDNAATALEAGAASLDMFVRRAALPRINKFTGIGSAGVAHGFAVLPDDWKWRFLHHVYQEQTPPPRDSTLRVARHPTARLHLASPVQSVSESETGLIVRTPQGAYDLDFLIFATGFSVDFEVRPELALIGPHIRRWGDRFEPAEGLAQPELALSPDLGADFAFQEKVAGACPALARIHCFNYPSTLSSGKLTGDIPGVSVGAQRLAIAITQALFVAEKEAVFLQLQTFATPELQGDEWLATPAPEMGRVA